MIFRRRRSGSGEEPGRASESERTGQQQSCPSLGKALERTFRLEHPSILDLGPMSGPTVTALASRGARVTVEEFVPPPPRSTAESDEDESPAPPLRLEHPDEVFDLILAWEHVDFVPPDRLEEFFAEIRRVLAENGWVLMFSQAKPQDTSLRGLVRYRIVDDQHVRREPAGQGDARRRFTHPTRAIESAMRGFSVQGIHLQRNQVREILAAKREGGKGRQKRIVQPRRPTHARPVRR